jgi:UDP-N-acetylmuramoyl-tripeptide--D-alanyl-D-alanine ligase
MSRLEQLTVADVAAATSGALSSGLVAGTALTGVSIDSRTIEPGQLFVAIVGPRFDGHAFVAEAAAKGAAAAVVQRALPQPVALPTVTVADTTAALGALAADWRERAPVPVVAITGSAGKTTTKEMTAWLLGARGEVLKSEGNLNNQYGLPLSLLRLRPRHTAAVLELGMSAPGELRTLSALARPDVAVITMVAPVHLEFFASVDAIADAKAEILEGLRPDGVAVLNGDDPRLRQRGRAHRGRVLWFGKDRAFDVSAENWRGTVHGMRFDMRMGGRALDVALPLAGPHFMMNFLAAAAAAHHLGVPAETIAERALSLRPVAHRGEVLRLGSGVTLLDDSYNSNPAAVEAAVAALTLAARGRRVAFLGDMLELGPTGPDLHAQTGSTVAGRLDLLVAAGELARHFVEGARRAGKDATALAAFPDSASAAEAAPGLVHPGDAVLVKGSRGARMEKVVEALRARFGAAGVGEPPEGEPA